MMIMMWMMMIFEMQGWSAWASGLRAGSGGLWKVKDQEVGQRTWGSPRSFKGECTG